MPGQTLICTRPEPTQLQKSRVAYVVLHVVSPSPVNTHSNDTCHLLSTYSMPGSKNFYMVFHLLLTTALWYVLLLFPFY